MKNTDIQTAWNILICYIPKRLHERAFDELVARTGKGENP